MARDEFQGFVEREIEKFVARPRAGLRLEPVLAERPLAVDASKLGGTPYLADGEGWPACPACEAPLLFAVQLARADFADFPFPAGKDLFQIFRCPRWDCRPEAWEAADRTMLHRFVAPESSPPEPAERPEFAEPDTDKQMPEHELRSQPISDYPATYTGRVDWWGDEWAAFQDECMELDSSDGNADFYEGSFWELIPNVEGFKIGGLPSWRQRGNDPVCSCGKKKQMVFQLASFYTKGWEHEMGIGDDGNIYYFHCMDCGESSLESLWDCA